MDMHADVDARRFHIHRSSLRGFDQAFVYEKAERGSGVALLCVHGWPESKRIFFFAITYFVS